MADYSDLPNHMNREELIQALMEAFGGDRFDYEVYPIHHLREQVADLNSSMPTMSNYSDLPPIYEVYHMNREELIEALVEVFGGDRFDYEVYPIHHLREQVAELNSSMLVSP